MYSDVLYKSRYCVVVCVKCVRGAVDGGCVGCSVFSCEVLCQWDCLVCVCVVFCCLSGHPLCLQYVLVAWPVLRGTSTSVSVVRSHQKLIA